MPVSASSQAQSGIGGDNYGRPGGGNNALIIAAVVGIVLLIAVALFTQQRR